MKVDLDAIETVFDNADYRLDSSDPWEPNEVQPLYAAGIALVARVRELEAILREAQEFVLTAEYIERFDNMYWAMADTLTKAIDAALVAVPAPPPAREVVRARVRELEAIVRAGREYVDAVKEKAPMTIKSLLFDEFAATLAPATATEGTQEG